MVTILKKLTVPYSFNKKVEVCSFSFFVSTTLFLYEQFYKNAEPQIFSKIRTAKNKLSLKLFLDQEQA